MILHVLRDCENITHQLIKRYRKNYEAGENIFYLYGMKGQAPVKLDPLNDVVHEEEKGAGSLLKELLDKADRVILHGLDNDVATIKRLRYYIKAAKKGKEIVWIEWGHDLYDAYWNSHSRARKEAGIVSRKNKLVYVIPMIEEHYRRELIKRLYMITSAREEREIITGWYKTDAKFIHRNAIGYGTGEDPVLPYHRNEDINIVIGHCPSHLCRLTETLELLKKYDDGRMKVYVTLFHKGERTDYIRETINKGEELYGKRFIPIEEHLPYEDFAVLMNNMDVAIYNQIRQMAKGNIQLMLHYGKKVFVSDENCLGQTFSKLGCVVYSMNDLNEKNLFEELSPEDRENNMRVIDDGLKDELFKSEWDRIFYE